MPGRNIVKAYASETYYHAYNRGVNRANIFLDDEDYRTFLNLLKRYLDTERAKDKFGRLYENMSQEIELVAYCLMPNHFHLFLYQHDETAMTRLLQRIITSYSVYFNKKYQRIGRLFQDRFKAVDIISEGHLWHISRYIHLNPTDIGQPWSTYPYSSLSYYLGERNATWVKPQRILEMFADDSRSYQKFLHDDVGYKDSLEIIKYDLAT